MVNIKYLSIGRISTNQLQIREKLDSDVVAEYVEVLAGGRKLPPLLVFFDGTSFFLADGFHRLQAARQLKLSRVACDVHEGTFGDARWAACGANVDHGLRRTNADKRRAVTVALELRPQESSRIIAEHVGVVHRMVDVMRQVATVANSNVRNPRQSAPSVSGNIPAGRIGRDGKLYPAVPMRHCKDVRSQQSEVSGTGETVGGSDGDATHRLESTTGDMQDADTAGAGAPVAAAAGDESFDGAQDRSLGGAQDKCFDRAQGEPAALVDSLGRHVPEDLAPLWHRRQEVQEALTSLSRIRSTIRHAQEGQDPLWAEINFSAVLMHLDRAYSEIDATKPYVVCPMCQGIGCRACKDRGLLGKFRYDTVIPRELKVTPRRE